MLLNNVRENLFIVLLYGEYNKIVLYSLYSLLLFPSVHSCNLFHCENKRNSLIHRLKDIISHTAITKPHVGVTFQNIIIGKKV